MTILRGSFSRAFSLIELLVVFALIAFAYALLSSNLSPEHRESQTERCSDNLQKIFLASQIYANDFGKFPLNTNARTSEQVLTELVPRYTADRSIFICPWGRDREISSDATLADCRISYAYYMGRGSNAEPGDFLLSDRQVNNLSKYAGDIVFSTNGSLPANNHGRYGGNVLFCDDSVQKIPPRTPFSLAFSNGIVLLNPKP
ncbi:MAG TPA: type II secretion system protein [Verrucomicrobiae bacterium]|jgi:type II secretory pathway pseudopilin PulG|nr:type II secretion system protein [Verrucomicrobiae bacterium]